MSTNDTTRNLFDAAKGYRNVAWQQGRVLVDDDLNEAARIQSEDRTAGLREMVGVGSPDDGFLITEATSSNGRFNCDIGAGTLYVGGERLEARPESTFQNQTDWLQLLDEQPPAPEAGRRDLVWVEAWVQDVGAVEDGELIDPALGIDTSARTRLTTRVRLLTEVGAQDCDGARSDLSDHLHELGLGTLDPSGEVTSDARLRVTYSTPVDADDECDPGVQGGYLGAENQLIRVELLGNNTLTWGYDNGGDWYRARLVDRTTLRLLTAPKDQQRWPREGQVVEIVPWGALLPNGEKIADTRGILRKLSVAYQPDEDGGIIMVDEEIRRLYGQAWRDRPDAITIDSDVLANHEARDLFVRLWNRGHDDAPSAIQFTRGAPLELGSTGLQVTVTGDELGPGHHWLISVRPHTDVPVQPWKLLRASGLPPMGYRRVAAPLALLHWTDANRALVYDCRTHFPPLTAITADDVAFDNENCQLPGAPSTVQEALNRMCSQRCCTITLVPGDNAEAILAAVPANAALHLCFAPGNHVLQNTLRIANRPAVIVSGLGHASFVAVTGNEAALDLRRCKTVTVRDLRVAGGSGAARPRGSGRKPPSSRHLNGAINCLDCSQVTITGVTATTKNGSSKESSCITVRSSDLDRRTSVRIVGNELYPGFQQIGILAINCDRCTIEDNRIQARDLGRRFSFDTAIRRDRLFRSAVRDAMIHGFDLEGAAANDRAIVSHEHAGERFIISFRTDPQLAADWQNLFISQPRYVINRITNARELRSNLLELAGDLLEAGGATNASRNFERWYEDARRSHDALAGQGVVVAGSLQRDVRVVGNTIEKVLEGVRIALSRQQPRTDYLSTRRVVVRDNTIDVLVPGYLVRERYGIYIGNCESLEVAANRVQVERGIGGRSLSISGIHLYGYYGPFAIVRDNHLEGCTPGVFTRAFGGRRRKKWLIADNLASVDQAETLFETRDNH
jgi:hypothetical protein